MDQREFYCAAVLFDLDGVLVDSTAGIARAWKRWAAIHRLDPNAIFTVSHGRRAVDVVAELLPAASLEQEIALLRTFELQTVASMTEIAGAIRFIAALGDAPWAVVTSGARPVAVARLHAAGIPVPHVIITAEDVRHGKPHPEPYLSAAVRLQIPTDRCVVFEDAPAGIASAQAAAARVIALTTTHARASLHRADAVVADFHDVDCTRVEDGLRIAVRPSRSAREPQ